MMVSTKGRYALRVMIDLAESPRDQFITLMDISQRQDISEKYLEGIMASLSREKMVYAVRGKGGGYMLAKEPDEYSVYSILEATEKNLVPVSCMKSGIQCYRADSCKTLPMWQHIDDMISDYLKNLTLADIVEGNV